MTDDRCAVVVVAGELQGQAQPDRGVTPIASRWVPRPLPPVFEFETEPPAARDSIRSRPFFLARPGEQTAYWLGLGAGLAVTVEGPKAVAPDRTMETVHPEVYRCI